VLFGPTHRNRHSPQCRSFCRIVLELGVCLPLEIF
jgi:hypothetical protein